MSKEEFFNGRSNPRNRELMRIFKDFDLVEHMGSGIQRILEVYGRECFLFSDNFINIVLPKTIVGGQFPKITKAQRKVLLLIIEIPNISRRQLANDLDINESAVQKHLEALKSKGYIKREGTKGGYWEIINKPS